MKKLFVLSDIHGFYSEMTEALDRAGFDTENDDHIVVICGDLLDRGTEARKCLEFVNFIGDRGIFIRGNHEELLIDALKRNFFRQHDYHNGTIDTVSQLSGFSVTDILSSDLTCQSAVTVVKNDGSLKKYYDRLTNYAIIGDYIFVHGWIPTHYRDGFPIQYGQGIMSEGKLLDLLTYGDWEEALWQNGMKCWKQGCRVDNKCIVCGHWHTSWGHTHLHNEGVEFPEDEGKDDVDYAHFEPFIDKGIIAMDACTAYSEIVNCVVLEVEEEEWQSRTLENTMNE